MTRKVKQEIISAAALRRAIDGSEIRPTEIVRESRKRRRRGVSKQVIFDAMNPAIKTRTRTLEAITEAMSAIWERRGRAVAPVLEGLVKHEAEKKQKRRDADGGSK